MVDKKITAKADKYLNEFLKDDASRAELLSTQYTHSSKYIRQETVKRGKNKPADDIVSASPMEYLFVYRVEHETNKKILLNQYIIMYMDDDGKLLEIVESG